MLTYGHLFKYIAENLDSKSGLYIGNFYFTETFCKENGIDSQRIILILYDFGGHNDVEIIHNVVGKIRPEIELDAEVETPVEFAIRNSLYCRWHEGMWVRCKKGDKGAKVDLNLAHARMFGKNG
jgi:hypothetical protein